jgi:hypothetical protein
VAIVDFQPVSSLRGFGAVPKRLCDWCGILYHWLHREVISADPDLQQAVAEIGHDVAGGQRG